MLHNTQSDLLPKPNCGACSTRATSCSLYIQAPTELLSPHDLFSCLSSEVRAEKALSGPERSRSKGREGVVLYTPAPAPLDRFSDDFE